MCIIIAKNKTDRLPTYEELKRCFEVNKDGSGFMYTVNKKVVIDKGYMTFKSFIKHYNKLCKKYHDFKNKCLVIHCRIGTAGSNSRENTHPYPITKNADDLHKSYFLTSLGVAHNGIISSYNPGYNSKEDTNDTQEFIKDYLAELNDNFKGFYKNENMLFAIKELTRSKLAFLDSEDNLTLVGDFTTDDNLSFSNTSYKPYEYKSWDYYQTKKPSYNYDYEEEETEVFKLEEKEEEDSQVVFDDDFLSAFDVPLGYYFQKYGCEPIEVKVHGYIYNPSDTGLYYENWSGNIELLGYDYDILDKNGDLVY